MSKKIHFKLIFTILLPALFLCCNKKEFLDEKPDSDFVIPTTLNDCRRLLDNERVMSETPVLGELSADDYYMPYNFWMNLNTREKNAYIWEKNIYQGETGIGDWDKPYEQVFYANVVRETLLKIEGPDRNKPEWSELYGATFFIRAYAFHNLLQVFSPVYDPALSEQENALGIPLRLEQDINPKSVRATVKESYDQIINDLHAALYYLPVGIPYQLNRPSKPAAYALMARVYLSKREFDSALYYADKSLELHSYLLNYDDPVPPVFDDNPEVLYQSRLLSTTSVLKAFVVPDCIVDSNLYRSYDTNDLRRSLYFTSTPNPKPGYYGGIFLFSGLATDEVYLIKAESLAETGNFTEGINVLNHLLQYRYRSGTFTPKTASNKEAALTQILTERRKELVFRGLRWTDLRRLNKDGRNITLKRMLDKEYILPPNHPNYVLPIPPDVPVFFKENLREEIP